jgi:hypothetical protein
MEDMDAMEELLPNPRQVSALATAARKRLSTVPPLPSWRKAAMRLSLSLPRPPRPRARSRPHPRARPFQRATRPNSAGASRTTPNVFLNCSTGARPGRADQVIRQGRLAERAVRPRAHYAPGRNGRDCSASDAPGSMGRGDGLGPSRRNRVRSRQLRFRSRRGPACRAHRPGAVSNPIRVRDWTGVSILGLLPQSLSLPHPTDPCDLPFAAQPS